MTKTFRKICLAVLILTIFYPPDVASGSEEEAEKWLQNLELEYSKQCNAITLKAWDSSVNITPATRKALSEQSEIFTGFTVKMQQTVLNNFSDWRTYKNKRLRRAMKILGIAGSGNMPIEKVYRMNELNSDFTTEFSTATVCKYNDPSDCSIKLRDIDSIMKKSTDPNELAHYFTAWHDKVSGRITPNMYAEYVGLLKEAALANGYQHYSELVVIPYDEETDDWTILKFQRIMVGLAEDIQRLYNILHAYVRMKLRKVPEYANLIEKCGYIPIHLTGNIYAQDWSAIERFTKPFPNAPEVDATDAMRKKGYTPLKMFQESDKFFRDLGLMGMTEEFWKNSVLEKPDDEREMNCHASAWDMCNGRGNRDMRIKQCTVVNQKDFFVAHHEMGHIEYYRQYSDLEFVFRTGANPGFHEAIGDSLALAVLTPAHLQCKLDLDLGFDKTYCEKKSGPFNVTETDLNYLFFMALQKLAFFPFGASLDFFRFEVFEGQIPKEDYNKMWWTLRQAFQGISLPTDRASNPNLFDPAAKFHIPANVDYLRYVVSHILQFQFYEALCIHAGEFVPNDKNSKPLYQCDFSGSKEAGKKLGDMMKLGGSKGWPEALEILTGTREMTVAPFQHYLQPILDFMEKELAENGEIIGFGDSCEDVAKRHGTIPWANLVPKHKIPTNRLDKFRPSSERKKPFDSVFQYIKNIATISALKS